MTLGKSLVKLGKTERREMDPKFIELHNGKMVVSVNIQHIVMVRDYDSGGVVDMTDSNAYHVAESYDEIKQLIKESGILIHKADPRLDTSHPLTYDEMREMPGQPVWHSNTDQWALIAEEPQYADRITVRHADGTYSNISREDTTAKPWYRMKQQTLIDALHRAEGDI